MKVTLGFSPCPNDTFIFDALVHGQVDTEGIDYEYFLLDVEQLNNRAFLEIPDVTKLSFHAFMLLAGKYLLLDSGSAMGFGTGPLLVSKSISNIEELEGKILAIPGIHTTANLISCLVIRQHVSRKEMQFSEIENAVLQGKADAGVIIHESRFTYMQKGLQKLLDLGECWEKLTGFPVPLGGIAAHKRLGDEVATRINRGIRRSVEFALSQKGSLSQFVRIHAATMDESVMRQHIDLYVNEFSVSLGVKGREAVKKMVELAFKNQLILSIPERIFSLL